MIAWLLTFIGIPLAHNILLKWTVYRWIINSLLYPIHLYKINKLYKKKTYEEALKSWCDYQVNQHWSKRFWFGRRLSKHVLLKYLDK